MSIFEAERLLRSYRQQNDCNVNEQVKPGTEKSSSSEPQIRRDKALGWIPNPRTPMNHFYNRVYESFFVENVTFLAMSKKKFSEEFHKEARRQYTVHQEAERLKAKIQQLDNANNPSTAGYLLRENHTLKPHDNTVIKMNLNRIEEAENLCNKLRKKLR